MAKKKCKSTPRSARKKAKPRPKKTRPAKQSEREPFGKFGTQTRIIYLQRLDMGVSPCNAAAEVGVSRELVRLYKKAYPEFKEEERQHIRCKLAHYERVLHDAAKAGNTAIALTLLRTKDPENWPGEKQNVKIEGKMKIKGTVDANVFADAAGYTAELAARLAPVASGNVSADGSGKPVGAAEAQGPA